MAGSPIKSTYIVELGDSLARSIEINQQLMEEMRGNIPEMIVSLRQMAEGVWHEEEYTARSGEIKRRVYQRDPNFSAVWLMLKLAGVSPKENADTLLSITRAQSSVADTSLKLEQRRLVIETALTMARNRIAADRSLVDEESVESAVSKSILDMLGFVQQLQLEDYPSDDMAKTRFVERYKDRCLQVLNDALDALPGQGALEPAVKAPYSGAKRGRKPKKKPEEEEEGD